jgi:hypothetical protein
MALHLSADEIIIPRCAEHPPRRGFPDGDSPQFRFLVPQRNTKNGQIRQAVRFVVSEMARRLRKLFATKNAQKSQKVLDRSGRGNTVSCSSFSSVERFGVFLRVAGASRRLGFRD